MPERDSSPPERAQPPDPGGEVEPDPGAKPGASAWAEWTGAGFEFGAAVLLFFLLGSFLDARWGTQPWLTVVGAFVGIVAGTYLLIRPALRSKPTDKPPRDLKRP